MTGMMFLLRAAFWLTIVALLLPTGPSKPQPRVGAVEAVSAAGAAVSDVSQFCKRQPEACEFGSQAAAAIGEKAQAGAKLLYDLLNEKKTSAEAPPNRAAASPNGSQHTLTPADVAPAYRGPEPRKEAHARRPA
jgi:Family of unknown function (DUF5330)